MSRYISFLILLNVLFFWACSSEDPPRIEPVMNSVDSLMQQEVPGNVSGAVLQIKRGEEVIHRKAYGYAHLLDAELDTLDNPVKMTPNHLFDLASLTKVFATTFAVMKLVDDDKLSLDDPAADYLSELKVDPEKKAITIRHLLSHTAGLKQWVPTYYFASNGEERLDYIAELPLEWEVGKERHYSDLGFMLLADVIEAVSAQRINEFLEDEIYTPSKLRQTFFNPLDKKVHADSIVATSHGNPFEKQMIQDDDFGYRVDVNPESWDDWRDYTLIGEVNDGNAWYANEGIAGHAGLFSTIDDLQRLVDVLLSRGKFNGEQLISAAVIDTFLAKDQFENGLGWAMDPGFISAAGAPEGTFGHTGFTGTSAVVVPEDSLSIIMLTNRQHNGREEDGTYYDLSSLRQNIVNKVME